MLWVREPEIKALRSHIKDRIGVHGWRIDDLFDGSFELHRAGVVWHLAGTSDGRLRIRDARDRSIVDEIDLADPFVFSKLDRRLGGG